MSRKDEKETVIKMKDKYPGVSIKLEQKQENCRDDISRLDLYMNFEEVASAIQRSLYSFRSDSIDRKDIKHAIKVIRTALKIMIGNEAIAIHNIPGMNAEDFGKESQSHVENPEIDDGFSIIDQDCNAADPDKFMKLLRHRGSRNHADKKPDEYGWSTGKNYISPDTLEAIDNRSAEEIVHSSWMDTTAHDKDKK